MAVWAGVLLRKIAPERNLYSTPLTSEFLIDTARSNPGGKANEAADWGSLVYTKI
jgi:hypothetical protein